VITVHKKINLQFIAEVLNKKPLICHIDDHALGDYSHASHFIVLEKATEKSVQIIDPWTGKRKKINKFTLERAITELKNQVKMCPLLFSVEA
jgi:ABC-type bacteriocin/lantibiotic exporter with double-glycine peptidase domain